MNKLFIASEKSSPEISFTPDEKYLSITGKSYPENSIAFFDPVMNWLNDYLTHADTKGEITLDMRTTYFNSSSSKAFYDIFELLDQSVRTDRQITINWYFHAEDEIIEEQGEEFEEDLKNVTFNMVNMNDTDSQK